MLVKDLLNWKELDDEQKAATKKKLADAAKIGAGFAAGVGAVCLGYKALGKVYSVSELAAFKGEDEKAYIGICRCTKSGNPSPFGFHQAFTAADDYETAIDDLNGAVDFLKKSIADRDAAKFNDAITDALD